LRLWEISINIKKGLTGFTESINRHRVLLAQVSFFIVIAVVIIYVFGLRNESLLFVVLIFGIYLVFSGRVSQFKVMNVEIVIKDIGDKQSELTEFGLTQPEVDSRYLLKADPIQLDNVINQLIRETKNVRILVIKKIENQHYDKEAAIKYLNYFTHVVFIDDNKIFYGFAMADQLSKKLQSPSQGDKLLTDINEWKLNPPIRNDISIIKGASRKQVLDKMKELGLTVLPVVSLGNSYEGVLDKDSIMSQITRDFYNYAKNPKGLPEF
jgi:hypothetical protein